jgi:hypothetical protein
MSSNQLVALLLLASSNQVFGNDSVGSSPNAIYDAPIDAPFKCSPIGVTPQFSPLLHQYAVEDCTYYAQVGSDAIGVCSIVTNIAPIGMPLVPALGIAATEIPPTPRLAPDGSYLMVGYLQTANPVVLRYVHDGDGWSIAAPQPELGAVVLGNIVHVAGADRITARFKGDSLIDELVFDGSAWTLVASHPPTELGIDQGPVSMWSSSDALRMVVSDGALNLYYSDRPSLDAPFRTADPLELSGSNNMSLSEDCSRIYMTGLGSILYAQQR